MSNDSVQQNCQEVADATAAAGCEGPAGVCPPLADVADRSGCGDEYTTYFDCWVAAPDVCNPADCFDEGNVAFECLTMFCIDHPTDPGCQGG